MKLGLAILDADSNYTQRITATLSLRYGDKLQIHGFTDPDSALNALAEERIHVFLADETFQIDTSRIPQDCGFAYLVSGNGIDALNGQKAINKFQQVDAIYRAVLDIFSDRAGNISFHNDKDGRSKLVVFSSPCGGTGTTSVAAAYAVRLAEQGQRVFYLNLECFNSSDALFEGEGQLGMDDVIYAIKSKKSNLTLKLESCARRDASGVYFFAPPRIALDLMELTDDELLELVDTLRDSGHYDVAVVDMDFSLKERALRVFRKASALVWVCDGSESANQKVHRAYETLKALEQRDDGAYSDNICVIYNKFSNKTGKIITDLQVRAPGGVPRLEHATPLQVRSHLATQQFLDEILG